jgi:serine/threonine protein kinase
VYRKQVIRKILKGKYDFKARMWKYVSDEAKMFVKRCLTYDPKARPTAVEALKLAWMQRDFDDLAPELDSMDMVQTALHSFASYGTLKKLALMVIAHKSTSEEIGFLRKLFTKYDTLKNGVITFPEFRDALVDYDYSEEELEIMYNGIVSEGNARLWRTLLLM